MTNNSMEEGKLPEGVTPSTEGAIELNAEDYPNDLHEVNKQVNEEIAAREQAAAEAHEALVNSLPGSLPEGIEQRIKDLEVAIQKEIEARGVDTTGFNNATGKMENLSPEDHAKVNEAAKAADDMQKSA